MPKPFRLFSTRPLPPDAEIVEHQGKPHVRIKDRGRTVMFPLTADGRGYLKPSKCWYFKCRDQHGIVRRVKGFADLRATEQLAAEMERKAARQRVGLIDAAEEHARRPLTEHLQDYAAHLRSKGNCPEHNQATTAKVSAILAGCGFVFPVDLDAGKVSAWLADRRRPGRAVELPPGGTFSSSEAARLLGTTVDAVRRFVARHRLPTVGTGRNRRLTRAAVEFLVEHRSKGASPRTVNGYIVALQGFVRWLVKSKRIGSNPLETLSLVNTAADVRRRRRELTVDELRRLFNAARASTRTYRGLTGEDRFMLYLTAAGTGFRARALANLTPENFDLTPPSAMVTLPARFDKSRRGKVQPLPSDVAAALRPYLAQKAAGRPIWGGTWHVTAAGSEMIRRDLDAAGIPYAIEGPDGPEYADFHALRHTYLTLLGRHGVDLRTAQELAGHSTPQLTARYSHRRLYDLAGAVDKLPPLVPTSEPSTSTAAIPLRLTGTEGGASGRKPNAMNRVDASAGVPPGVPPGVPTGYAGLHSSAQKGTIGLVSPESTHSPQVLETQQPDAVLRQVASDGLSEDDGGQTHSPRIEIPVIERPERLLLRVSHHFYTTEAEIDRLADVLQQLLRL